MINFTLGVFLSVVTGVFVGVTLNPGCGLAAAFGLLAVGFFILAGAEKVNLR